MMGPSSIGDEVYVTDNLIEMYLEIDNDNDLMGCFLNLPHLTFDSNPLSMIKIHNQPWTTIKITTLQKLAANNPIQFPTLDINGF